MGDGSYLRLWPVEDLPEKNQTLQPQRAKDVVLIGSDGADDLFGIHRTKDGYNYVVYPRIELVREGKRLSNSWDGFLESLSRM